MSADGESRTYLKKRQLGCLCAGIVSQVVQGSCRKLTVVQGSCRKGREETLQGRRELCEAGGLAASLGGQDGARGDELTALPLRIVVQHARDVLRFIGGAAGAGGTFHWSELGNKGQDFGPSTSLCADSRTRLAMLAEMAAR